MTGNYLWKDKKRTLFGLPLSFTTYALTDEKLLTEYGLINTTYEEIRLYRIMDVTLKRSIFQRIFGVGTIHCSSSDRSTPEFDIVSVKNSEQVMELLSQKVEEERNKKRVINGEIITDDIH